MRSYLVALLFSMLSAAVLAADEQSGGSGDVEPGERLQFTEKDLPKDEKDPNGVSEIDQYAQSHGFNYARLTRRAAKGDAKALKRFFEIAKEVDGAAAESHDGMPTVVYHLLGDEKLAKFLSAQPLSYRVMVRDSIVSDEPGAPSAYFHRYFPETTRVLLRKEILDWPSPDKRYAIRKIFTDELNLRGSKVERAELLEQPSGRVLCDMTAGDIGTGPAREGEVLWSPDSKRFAYMTSDLTIAPGNLWSKPSPAPQRKQTAVYQLAGETFARVELPLSDVPGRQSDTELGDAVLGHEYTEPLRWEKPNVLILERHEYYENLKPLIVGDSKFDTIHPFGRLYRIKVTMAPDGNATVAWKLRQDR